MDDTLRFVIDRSVEPTNNRVERAIRSIVTYRNVFIGSRSEGVTIRQLYIYLCILIRDTTIMSQLWEWEGQVMHSIPN
ncbi:MAG: IS66 family transposase [Candidatus Thermoplasmatota archaeon]|nr:IS66 family transposase [Candidatus Thermoplasmatota archaeon]